MQVYVHRDGQNMGPYTISQLRPYLDQGSFKKNDLACHDGTNWISLKDVPGLITGKASRKKGTFIGKPDSKHVKRRVLLFAAVTLLVCSVGISAYFFLNEEDQSVTLKETSRTNLLEINPGQVVDVYDGDTFKVDLEGVHPLFGDNLPIRVKGIDTPEIRGTSDELKALAIEARNLTESMLKGAKKIELRNPERGKYFRIVAEVWIDGNALAVMLKDKGLAKDYDGEGKRPEW